jgi:hypothetical protein
MTHHNVSVGVYGEQTTGATRASNEGFRKPKGMKIGSANSTGESFYKNFARAWSRNRDIVNDQLAVTHYDSTHNSFSFEVFRPLSAFSVVCGKRNHQSFLGAFEVTLSRMLHN